MTVSGDLQGWTQIAASLHISDGSWLVGVRAQSCRELQPLQLGERLRRKLIEAGVVMQADDSEDARVLDNAMAAYAILS